jgi:hypothetical protein
MFKSDRKMGNGDWITNFKISRALRLLFLSILIWGRKVSLLSKRRPKI